MDSSQSKVSFEHKESEGGHFIHLSVDCRLGESVGLLQSLIDTQIQPLAERLDPEGLAMAEHIQSLPSDW